MHILKVLFVDSFSFSYNISPSGLK